MSEEMTFKWISFYEELSAKLLSFRNNQKELISTLKNEDIAEINKFIVNDNEISPFAIFEAFNRQNSALSQRKNVIEALKHAFDLTSEIPDSLPDILKSQKLDYFEMLQKRNGLIEISWNLLQAMYSKNEADIIKYYDDFISIDDAGFVCLTVAMYWAFPARYLPCSIEIRKKFESDFGISIPDANLKCGDYLNILKKINDIPKFVSEAVSLYSQNNSEWLPKDYNPGISKEKWIELIKDKTVFTENSLLTFACIQNAKIATCADMAKEFGRTPQFYNNTGWQTGQRVFNKTGKQPPKDENDQIWFWSSCCCFRKNKDKLWEFKIYPELKEAFEETGILDNIELCEKGENKTRRYWVARLTNDDYWENAIDKNVWYCQQRYGFQGTAAVTNFLSKVKEVSENDVIFLAYGNKLYSYGFVRPCPFESKQITSIEKIISEKSYEYKSGIVKFTDCNTFYEDLSNGEESWGQRICVEKWLFYNENSAVNTYGITDSILLGIVQESIFEVTKDYGELKMNELKEQFENTKPFSEKLADLLRTTHNLILHGAPGTGKTHLAKKIAEAMCAEVGFVQFHPSYDYTDFVEGLRPVNNGEQIGFERKDGVFKKFCERAIKSTVDNSSDNFDEIWNKLIEQLNESDFIEVPLLTGKAVMRIELNEYGDGLANRTYEDDEYQQGKWLRGQSKFFTKEQCYNIYKGLKGIPSGGHDNYRKAIVKYMKDKMGLKEYKEGTETSENKKPFIFIIDEINRGEMSKIFGELFFSIDPGYRGKKGLIKTQYQNLIQENNVFYDGFYIPENVYIIGTMNDIDRSVESMDFAFRRRFTFKEIKANENLGMLEELDDSIREKAKQTLLSLNNAIWNEESKTGIEGLSSAYHIGGAYFLKLKELGNDFDKLWEYHLEGLLREYLRGMEDSEESLAQLKNAYDHPEKNSIEELGGKEQKN